QVVLERGVRIVGQAREVHAQVLHPGPFLAQLVVADRGEVGLGLLVLAHAAQEDGGAVEGEALAVGAEVAEAEALGDRVGGASVRRPGRGGGGGGGGGGPRAGRRAGAGGGPPPPRAPPPPPSPPRTAWPPRVRRRRGRGS